MAGIATYSSTRSTSSVRARSELSPNSTRKMPVSTRTDNARNDLELRVESEHPEQGLGAMDTTTGSIYIICAKQSMHRELRRAVECHVQPRDPTSRLLGDAVLLIDNGPPRCHHAQHPFHPSRQSTRNPSTTVEQEELRAIIRFREGEEMSQNGRRSRGARPQVSLLPTPSV